MVLQIPKSSNEENPKKLQNAEILQKFLFKLWIDPSREVQHLRMLFGRLETTWTDLDHEP